MEFLEKIPDKLKQFLDLNNIFGVNLYYATDLDEYMKYKPIHFVVSNNTLFKINLENNKIEQFSRSIIDGVYIDYLLTNGRIYLKTKDGKIIFLSYFSKTNSARAILFERYLIKALDNQLTDDDYNNPDVINNKQIRCPKCHRIIPNNTSTCKFCGGKKGTILRLLSYIKNYKLSFFLVIILLLVIAFIGIIVPILTGKILYNDILSSEGKFYGAILGFVLVYFTLKLLDSIFNMIYGIILAKVSSCLCFDIKNDVFKSMQTLSLKFFLDKDTGSLMNRIVWDSNQVYYYIIDNIPIFFTSILKLIGIMVYLLFLNPLLTLLMLIPLPFLFIFYFKNNNIFRYYWNQNHLKQNRLSSLINDTLEGFRVVKVFSGQSKEINKFKKSSKNLADIQTKRQQFISLIYPLFNAFPNIMGFVVWGLGGYLVIVDKIDYGILMTFTASLYLVYGPFDYFNNFIFNYTPWALNSAKRIFEIIDAKPTVVEAQNPVEMKKFRGNIEFKNVDFAYDVNQPILDNISFKINENETIGIVGKTGAGKTTIVNLLTRLYDVSNGEILIDGINIKRLKLKELHSQIVLISQDIYLFKGTIYDNIAYAKDNATYEEVIEAAKLSHAHDFIINLENGYDTLIGEGNINLSGGERQRISIARAILLNPKILIFDEATASLDTKTERLIQDSITNLSAGKTVILIAHRLSTLKDANRLIVIDNKKIVEQGTMDELLTNGKEFAELYRIQQEGLKFIRVGD